MGAAGVLSLASGNEANRKCVGMGKADRSAEQYDVVRPGLAQLVAAGYVQHHAKRHASAGLKRNRFRCRGIRCRVLDGLPIGVHDLESCRPVDGR